MDLTRAGALALDAADPLAALRDEVVVADDDLLYLDGNSLGRLPRATPDRLARLVTEEWGRGLVRSWEHWVDRPREVGDLLGAVLGAAPGQVVVADTVTLHLYRLAAAALDARPDRRVVVVEEDAFPTDRYVVAGLAAERGLEVRTVAAAPDGSLAPRSLAAAVDSDVAVVLLAHVDYRSGALVDLAAAADVAHAAGALLLADLSHSAGSVPAGLDAAGVDLATGCTYKHLCGGPGAPAFAYVRADLQPVLRPPVWGWFGQREQFAMGGRFDPQPDVRRFLTGTPPVVALAAVEEGVRLVARAGIDRVRAKAAGLTSLLVALADARLAPLGFGLASPRDPARRGAHVSLAHPEALAVSRALVAHAAVVPDFRPPDRLRLGPSPLYGSYVEVWDAVDRIADVIARGLHHDVDTTGLVVT